MIPVIVQNLTLLFSLTLWNDGVQCTPSQIKKHLIEADAVALVKVTKIKKIKNLAGIYLYDARAEIQSPIKGYLTTKSIIHYEIEAAYDYKMKKGLMIVFLKAISYGDNYPTRLMQITEVGAIPFSCANEPNTVAAVKKIHIESKSKTE